SLAAAREALARDLGITAGADNLAAVRGAAVVVLAVKPQDPASVLTALAGQWGAPEPLLISVAGALRVATLQSWCGPGVAVVRAMPNRPALVGAAATGLFAPPGVTASQRATAEQILSSVGEVVWVATEATLDVVTALSGSGPAYFFLLAELMAEAAAGLGLPAPTAQRLAPPPPPRARPPRVPRRAPRRGRPHGGRRGCGPRDAAGRGRFQGRHNRGGARGVRRRRSQGNGRARARRRRPARPRARRPGRGPSVRAAP